MLENTFYSTTSGVRNDTCAWAPNSVFRNPGTGASSKHPKMIENVLKEAEKKAEQILVFMAFKPYEAASGPRDSLEPPPGIWLSPTVSDPLWPQVQDEPRNALYSITLGV